MAKINDVRLALANAIDTIDGLRGLHYVPGQVNPPQALVIPGLGPSSSEGNPVIRYDSTMANGSHDYLFMVKLIVGKVSDRAAQEKLDAFVDSEGSQSVKLAIENDMSLGGEVSFARVKSCIHYGIVTWGQIEFLGAELLVEATT